VNKFELQLPEGEHNFPCNICKHDHDGIFDCMNCHLPKMNKKDIYDLYNKLTNLLESTINKE
jgi:hypothetical protein